jgi:hypothetical protein
MHMMSLQKLLTLQTQNREQEDAIRYLTVGARVLSVLCCFRSVTLHLRMIS